MATDKVCAEPFRVSDYLQTVHSIQAYLESCSDLAALECESGLSNEEFLKLAVRDASAALKNILENNFVEISPKRYSK